MAIYRNRTPAERAAIQRYYLENDPVAASRYREYRERERRRKETLKLLREVAEDTKRKNAIFREYVASPDVQAEIDIATKKDLRLYLENNS